MARRAPLRSVPSPGSSKKAPTVEWVGGRLRTDIGVEEEGRRFFLDLLLWMELPSGLVLATRVMEPRVEPDALARLFVATLNGPAGGPVRIPDRVRVRTNADAVLLAAVLPGSVALQIAPAPELDVLLADFQHSMPTGGVEASYFDDGASAPVLATLFRASRDLYQAAPWKLGYDCDLLRVDAPEAGIEGACVSILGANGEVFGFSLFDSQDDYEEFLAATEALGDLGGGPPPPSHDFGASWHLLSFDRGADLPKKMRREVRDHGWPLAGPKAYPTFTGRSRDGEPLALDDDDLLRLAVCADAVAVFATKHAQAFRDMEDGGLPDEGITMRHRGEGLPECVVTFPYDPGIWAGEKRWFDADGQIDGTTIIRDYKVRHYEAWPDMPLPALGDRTPRKACRTKAGKREVDALLREMEQHEAGQPEGERYDFAGVRRELGLE